MDHFIIYRSVAQHPFPHPTDLECLRIARTRNAEAGITGFLVRTSNPFFQVLEGPKDAVLTLIDRIQNDDLHHGVQILAQGDAHSRRFSGRAMGYAEDYGDDPEADIFADPRTEESPELLILAMQGRALRRAARDAAASQLGV